MLLCFRPKRRQPRRKQQPRTQPKRRQRGRHSCYNHHVARMTNTAPRPCLFTLTHSHTHTHSLSLVLVVMNKSKELKTKISHAHSLILSHTVHNVPSHCAHNLDLDACSLSYYAHCPLNFLLSLTVCTLKRVPLQRVEHSKMGCHESKDKQIEHPIKDLHVKDPVASPPETTSPPAPPAARKRGGMDGNVCCRRQSNESCSICADMKDSTMR